MTNTREEWLNQVAQLMAPWFDALGCPLPRVRMAIGFPSTGSKGKRIGECWAGEASADGTHEILIRPDLDDALDVAAILAHELTHAAVGIPAGHGATFAKVAKAIGLVGKMTATTAGDVFKRDAAPILDAVGALPHARLGFGMSSGPKKQKGRLLKAECPTCGYTVRVTPKWVEEAGAPWCPKHGAMEVEGFEDMDEIDELED
jgi:hypothetical protein